MNWTSIRKFAFIAFLLLTAGLSAAASSHPAGTEAAYGLLERRLGTRGGGIEFEKITSDSLDVFTIESRGGRIVIGGNNVNAMACGLNHYLRYFCGVEIGWLEGQEALQKQIVGRERELGIRTALPAFSGHVPEQLCELYPDAPISHIRPWAGYTDVEAPWFLDPTSSLYALIQKKFITKQTQMYGSDHIYGLDIFNEIKPPSRESGYLRRVSCQIYESLSAVDPQAVWLQMGWLFSNNPKLWTQERIEAYLGGVPADRQLIMDYHADGVEVWRTTDNFYGVPFLWCYLSNFGGNTHMAPRFIRALDRLETDFWKNDRSRYPSVASGDARKLVLKVFARYRD